MVAWASSALTVGDPMGANDKVNSGSEVIVDSIDGSSRTVDLDSVLSGTVILINHEEYMKILNGTWVRYTGSTISSENLTLQIRKAQSEDLNTTLIHFA